MDHVLIDGRPFSDINDVRTYRGTNIDSDHQVKVKLRPKLSAINNVRVINSVRGSVADKGRA